MKIDADALSQIIYVGLAAAGGTARYLFQYIETGQFKFALLMAHVAVSAFSGYMFAEFAIYTGIKESGLFLFAGIGGFLGTKALEIVESYLKMDKFDQHAAHRDAEDKSIPLKKPKNDHLKGEE